MTTARIQKNRFMSEASKGEETDEGVDSEKQRDPAGGAPVKPRTSLAEDYLIYRLRTFI
jgi:hypothetical protein